MKIFHYVAISLTAEIITSPILAKLEQLFPGKQVENVTFPKDIEASKIRSLFVGKFLDENPDDQFSINCYIFKQGVILFEIIIYTESNSKTYLDPEFCSKKLHLKINYEIKNEPLYLQFQFLMIELFNIHSISKDLDKIDYLEDDSAEHFAAILKNKFHLKAETFGSNTSLSLNPSICKYVIVTIDKKTDSVVLKDRTFYQGSDNHKFRNSFIFEVYKTALFETNNGIVLYILDLLKEESKTIKANLSVSNRLYWEKLQQKLETYTLDFIHFEARINALKNSFLPAEMFKVHNSDLSALRDELKEVIYNTMTNIESCNKLLERLSIPSKHRNEKLLQNATEKVNERILLLSFLALTIPLVGTIFAPTARGEVKLLLAGMVVSLPLIYHFIRKIKVKKLSKDNEAKFFENSLKSAEQELQTIEARITELESDTTLDQLSKDSGIKLFRQSALTTQKRIKKLNEKLKIR